MIDIHTHILPQVDDGAIDIDESIEMIKMSIESGVEKIILTPHYYGNGRNQYSYGELLIRFEDFKSRVEEMLDIEIFLAQEIHYSRNIIELFKSGDVNTINNTNYLFTELPICKEVDHEEYFYEISLMDKRIVLAHPERSLWLKVDDIKKIVCSGILVQLNAGSLLGEFGSKVKKRAQKLMKLKLVHFIASDCHKVDKRIPNLHLAAKYVKKKHGEKVFNELFKDNPGRLLLNDEI
ncbi:CpsB/CapC family capsule biosynthesis tyrosine phosphatase [Mycoplasmatota bacterium WC44]